MIPRQDQKLLASLRFEISELSEQVKFLLMLLSASSPAEGEAAEEEGRAHQGPEQSHRRARGPAKRSGEVTRREAWDPEMRRGRGDEKRKARRGEERKGKWESSSSDGRTF